MGQIRYYLKLVKLAKLFDKNNLFFESDKLIRISQNIIADDSEFVKDQVNPISRIYGDKEKYLMYKGVPGKGTFNLPDNILSTLDIPPRFKGRNLDEVAREINTKIPPFNPAIHQTTFNYQLNFIPEFVSLPENAEYFNDVVKLSKEIKKFLFKEKPLLQDENLNKIIQDVIGSTEDLFNESTPVGLAIKSIENKTSRNTNQPPSRGTSRKKSNPRITSPFGERNDPNNPSQIKQHGGIDIKAADGTPVKSAFDGTVIFAGNYGDYGNLIKIQHSNNYESRYAHLSSFSVSKDDQVIKGQVIGLSGSTGNATGPHLHFELRQNGSPVDPEAYINSVI